LYLFADALNASWKVNLISTTLYQDGIVMRSISDLREALLNVFLPESTSYDEQELFDELMVQKPRLLALLHTGSRNEGD